MKLCLLGEWCQKYRRTLKAADLNQVQSNTKIKNCLIDLFQCFVFLLGLGFVLSGVSTNQQAAATTHDDRTSIRFVFFTSIFVVRLIRHHRRR